MATVIAILGVAATLAGWSLLTYRVVAFTSVFRSGQRELPGVRSAQPGRRTAAVLREFLAHQQMRRKPVIALAHWFTMMSFLVLVSTLVAATGQLFAPHFTLPLLGSWVGYAWAVELLAWAGLVGILVLIGVRLWLSRPSLGTQSRFFGSHQWRARYVEATILAVVVLVLWLRGVESAYDAAPTALAHSEALSANTALFPTTAWIGTFYQGLDPAALDWWIRWLALAKILVSYAWMVVVSLTPTMGVAWHRFLAFPTLWTTKNPSGAPALGGLEPLVVAGAAVDLNDPDTPDSVYEHLGVATASDLTWRDRLALTTCTECGRCQEVCPAWATGKPLSPKLLVGALRDAVWAADQTLPLVSALAGSKTEINPGVKSSSGAETDATSAANLGAESNPGSKAKALNQPDGDFPPCLSPEALWSCTTCGACTDICPVGIEQVDHVIDLRRHQVLGLAEFPNELETAFRSLERRKNPWGMPAKKRLDWAASLDFDVPVLGVDVDSMDQLDYLYWVGCAGAFDERGSAVARALATLLHRAEVSFAVLGSAECCTGDPARRAGNEPLFAQMAATNVETLNGVGATRIVVTCAHCLNSLANEYGPFGGRYEVVHHTELLAQLVEAGRLRPGELPPVLAGATDTPLDATSNSGPNTDSNTATAAPVTITYQDPCYLSRHNGQTSAPRKVLGAIGNLELREMACSGRNSVCCGAGGGRMWLEEDLGSRINARRLEQADATGAALVATACPFCSTMLGDAAAAAESPLAVQDVAQLLLAALPEPPEVPAEPDLQPPTKPSTTSLAGKGNS